MIKEKEMQLVVQVEMALSLANIVLPFLVVTKHGVLSSCCGLPPELSTVLSLLILDS